MTNTPSPTDEDRELIEGKIARILEQVEGYRGLVHQRQAEAIYAKVVESLLSDRAKLVENAAQIAESHAVCGCNGEHGSCLIDDSPKAIAEEIRALNRSTDRG